MAYTDVASIQARTGKTYTGAELTYLSIVISAVTNYINQYTNRVFEEVASADYYYFGNKSRELEVDDFTEITAIKEYNSDGDLIYTFDTTEYELLPLNTVPKDHIYLLQGVFTGYKYKVTGKKGYSVTCPADIKMLATELCANLITADAAGKKSETIEGYSYQLGGGIADIVNTSPVYKSVLDSYRKILV